MNSTKTRVRRNQDCGVEFVMEVQGQRYCAPCRQARAKAAGKVCHLCGGISDVTEEGCWPCRRAELARVAEKRRQEGNSGTKPTLNRSLLGRFAQMSKDVQWGYILEMLRLMGVGNSDFMSWFDSLSSEMQNDVYRGMCSDYAKLGLPPVSSVSVGAPPLEVSLEMIDADDQAAIDAVFASIMEGIEL